MSDDLRIGRVVNGFHASHLFVDRRLVLFEEFRQL